jgi:Erg28 like protein
MFVRIYDIAMWTYFIAFAHFASEVLIFRTANVKGPTVAPFLVASRYPDPCQHEALSWLFTGSSLVWMFLQYDFYVAKA